MAACNRGMTGLLEEREVQLPADQSVRIQRKMACSHSVIDRLALHKCLEGHAGCVNCLEWSRDGRLLVSGSDDLHAYIWDAERMCEATNFHTGHSGNIFSVNFVQQMNNRLLTCADDRQVRYHDILAKETMSVWHCSAARVKRLATVSSEPHLFWSAAEDGFVRQYDLREPHQCSSGSDCGNVVVDLRHVAAEPQCKCLAANQVRTELLAVGSIDPFVRLFDRRVFSPGCSSARTNMSSQPSCVGYFSPGHLSDTSRAGRSRKAVHTLTVTYVAFSPDGSEMLVNMSDEYVYLYGLLGEDNPIRYRCPQGVEGLAHPARQHPLPAEPLRRPNISFVSRCHHYAAGQSSEVAGGEDQPVSTLAEQLTTEGRALHRQKLHFEAVQKFNEAIAMGPVTASMYVHRASSCLARKWEGDVYSALRDAESALSLDPAHQTAQTQLILALSELGWREEARQWFLHYQATGTGTGTAGERSASEGLKEKMDKLLNRSSGGVDRQHSRGPRRGPLLEWERQMQAGARDYQSRFCGHWNTNTDIKEANFLGPNGEFVAAGSDDGNVFIWERASGRLVQVLIGDKQITNCVQWHPSRPLLATSGIEHTVKLWGPQGEGGGGGRGQEGEGERQQPAGVLEAERFGKVCKSNQRSMRIDPYTVMLMHMGFSAPDLLQGEGEEEGLLGEQDAAQIRHLECRQS